MSQKSQKVLYKKEKKKLNYIFICNYLVQCVDESWSELEGEERPYNVEKIIIKDEKHKPKVMGVE